MNFIRTRLSKRKHSDRADSHIISFVLIFPLFFSMLMTIIDTSVYFSNANIITNLTKDAARHAAIIGGPGNTVYRSRLEQDYGFTNCTPAASNKIFTGNSSGSATECVLMNNISQNSRLINVLVWHAICNVPTVAEGNAMGNYNLTSAPGQEISCSVGWQYRGMPGSVLSYIGGDGGGGQRDDSEVMYGENWGMLGWNRTKQFAKSEVGLTSTDAVSR